MIFESEGSYETMFLQDPPPGAVSFTRRPTSTMLNWFRSTPICLRKILYDCTSPRQRRFYPKLETLRETIADQTRHPWSPIYRSFDSSQTSNLWQMQVDAGELPAAFTDLYGKYSQTFEAFMRDFKSRSKGRKEKAEETSTMEAGDTKHEIKTPGDAKEEDFKEIKTTGVRVKDAEQKETQAEISRLMSHIGNWHEAKTGCYCVLPPEDIWMSIEHIAENTWRRKRAHH
ncbi:hypothetical protein L211DRAFT_579562 [Terfezia boudieri ATCC MYA-4762]|uniref:Uncharacterized protein n=1 Tax=Terfezia boudieri ATCC MYA-4762 TaxID=1051890 RepID=A0A3N4LAS6_9PEZI|nr:hypothetical protein L211DRAFT_579562 [Terfezia boudieri ATCC MYA-4762]